MAKAIGDPKGDVIESCIAVVVVVAAAAEEDPKTGESDCIPGPMIRLWSLFCLWIVNNKLGGVLGCSCGKK